MKIRHKLLDTITKHVMNKNFLCYNTGQETFQDHYVKPINYRFIYVIFNMMVSFSRQLRNTQHYHLSVTLRINYVTILRFPRLRRQKVLSCNKNDVKSHLIMYNLAYARKISLKNEQPPTAVTNK